MKRLLVLLGLCVAISANAASNWSQEKANAWYEKQNWPVGCNFSPSTAINQLEMWQAETFDPATIDRELGWAEGLGFNTVRVFLHNIPWQQDSAGYTQRIEKFLELANKHQIKPMFVLFDSCWNPFPKAGKQSAPKPHLHNSGWVQCPGTEILKNPARHDEMEGFVKGVIGHFANDKRILAWDLFNEPDNDNATSYGQWEFKEKPQMALQLLKKEFAWARSVNPTQPLTAAPWHGDWSAPEKMTELDRYMFEASDIISYHCYDPLNEMQKRVEFLKRYGRPMICSEYMARPVNSTFNPILGYLKSQKVGAYNWGFVDGKTQTIYPWDSWDKKNYTSEPPLWFHDIFRKDGTAYKPEEVEYIKGLTGKK